MTIDIRANVSCSLGEVISGDLGDDYIQGNGLIKTTGSVLIKGLITPDVGTLVSFSYSKNGITYNIPRSVRVKSSFADPFRGTTQVELGCKLDYLSDLKDKINWTAFDDPENSDASEDDARIVTIPINASSIMNQCLTELGITATSNPLTNKFSIASFDFSSGYVSILNDLLVSESYCGYLDANEKLQIFSLDQVGGTGPVLTYDDIIDLGPIGVGQLPGEAVTVSYSSLRLKPPEISSYPDEEEEEEEEIQKEISRINWERDTTVSTPELYYINYRNALGNLAVRTYTSSTSTEAVTTYMLIGITNEDGTWEQKEVVKSRTTTETTGAITKLANCASKYAENGIPFYNASISTVTTETYTYDRYGEQETCITLKYEPKAVVLGAANFDWVYDNGYYTAPYDRILSEATYVKNEKVGDFTKTITATYLLFAFTQAGQQAIAVARELFPDSVQLAETIVDAALYSGLVHNKTTVQSKRTGAIDTAQQRPEPADRINSTYSNGGDPNNGWRTESTADLELALGSATAQRRIEFSMPYAPDDTFKQLTSPVTGLPMGVFTSKASDAPAKANRYGRVQNNLLLGNRSGASLQMAPEKLPIAPFSPFYLAAGGFSVLYRVNATNWAFDSSGVICSVDALLWGTAGTLSGTGGLPWIPVAPGVTTLPSAPPIINTAPTQVIGSIETVGETPQTALSSAFPDATDGDGVQDTTSGSFWTYDTGIWTDVGATPGPTTTTTSVVKLYNLTSIYDSQIYLAGTVSKFNYALELLTEFESTIVIPAEALSVVPIRILSSSEYVVESHIPTIMNSLDVRVDNVPGTVLAAEAPEILNSTDVRVLAESDFAISSYVPEVGSNIGLIVAPPVVDILISAAIPQAGSNIGLVVSPATTDVTIAAMIPQIGGLVKVPATTISLERVAPTITTI